MSVVGWGLWPFCAAALLEEQGSAFDHEETLVKAGKYRSENKPSVTALCFGDFYFEVSVVIVRTRSSSIPVMCSPVFHPLPPFWLITVHLLHVSSSHCHPCVVVLSLCVSVGEFSLCQFVGSLSVTFLFLSPTAIHWKQFQNKAGNSNFRIRTTNNTEQWQSQWITTQNA